MAGKDKLTCDDLRSIQTGQTKRFTLPDAKSCYNGKSLAYQLQNILGCKFSVQTDYADNTLTITRNAL